MAGACGNARLELQQPARMRVPTGYETVCSWRQIGSGRHFALTLRLPRNLYAACGDYTQLEKTDETQVRNSRTGRFRWRSTFDQNRFGNATRPLGTGPNFERRKRCSGLRSTRLRPHGARVSARGLRRTPPLCTSRLRIPSGLSSVLIPKEGFGPLFSSY